MINFVVLTAAASSCNSGIFSNSRMLFGLSSQQQAPRTFLRRINMAFHMLQSLLHQHYYLWQHY
ncbi:hypothetical protein ACVPOS_14150 [Staphylococcus aureus]